MDRVRELVDDVTEQSGFVGSSGTVEENGRVDAVVVVGSGGGGAKERKEEGTDCNSGGS